MKNHITALAIVLALMLPPVAFAAAQSVFYGDVEGSAETSVSVGGLDLDAGVGNAVNARAGADATISGSSGSSDGVAANDSANAGAGTLEVIVITRADVDAGTVSTINVSPASVHSNADLSGFVAAQIASDKNVVEVETSSDNVSVTHKQKAKLFGLIPVTVNATATVLADGSVDIRYPWYAFFMVTNEHSLEAAIEERVGAIVSAGAAEGDASLELSSSEQAMLISEVRSIMDQELAADIAADAAIDAKGSGVVEVK